ncbi:MULTISPECIES: hypothetical protein [unclassified Streptomyces]|uniref:hypothetical protein n=1 Tax=unclassified Streptomyces TaxID=2593676 RepID=UPI003D94BF99
MPELPPHPELLHAILRRLDEQVVENETVGIHLQLQLDAVREARMPQPRRSDGNRARPNTKHAASPDDGFHAVRHTFASVQLGARESVVAVSKWLGHSDPSITDHAQDLCAHDAGVGRRWMPGSRALRQ